jgi:hypothetical protein
LLRSLQEIQPDVEEEAKAYAGLWSQGKKKKTTMKLGTHVASEKNTKFPLENLEGRSHMGAVCHRIGGSGRNAWPSRSPNLTSADFLSCQGQSFSAILVKQYE